MSFLWSLLIFLHVVGASLVFGLWVAHFRRPTVLPGQFHAALLQLVTGLILFGLAESSGGANHIKLGVHLLVGLTVVVCAFIGQRKTRRGEAVSTGLAHAVGGLALINMAIALLWH